ncbi:hypothetical protein ZIOFF_069611 [Zingiber officinale]|uniref:Retrotransposon gag domain-containing protein n=1 Tax=Zingiber officinale TaxID=94328 RepID=A0A8J5CBF8_ZINOF|nr:hypothetical protein ZIOFF_069611 [Zingiber officinale]
MVGIKVLEEKIARCTPFLMEYNSIWELAGRFRNPHVEVKFLCEAKGFKFLYALLTEIAMNCYRIGFRIEVPIEDIDRFCSYMLLVWLAVLLVFLWKLNPLSYTTDECSTEMPVVNCPLQKVRDFVGNNGMKVLAGRRNNNNGEVGGQNTQFLEGLTALLHEQNRIHGEQIQQILQAREQGSTPRRSAPSTQPVYKQFRELGPTEFKGTTGPIAAEGWIRSLETIFDFMQLTDADKVRCAIFMLRDDAQVWWEGARLTVDLATLTWTDFKEVFYGKYFTVDNRTRLAREFLELRQGDLSVAEYVRRFKRGRYFVPMITSQPVEELKHFTEGLRSAIRHDVRLSRVTTFREAVDQALMSERDRNDMIKEAQKKRLSYQGRD